MTTKQWIRYQNLTLIDEVRPLTDEERVELNELTALVEESANVKNTKYSPIANGECVCNYIKVLKDLRLWRAMTEEEKQFFLPCHKCKAYSEYAKDKTNNFCPCLTCEHHKTEIQVDNRVITLRRKYL